MGWCSATMIFDAVMGAILDMEPQTEMTKEAIIRKLTKALEDGDWDCQDSSGYRNHPLVLKVWKEMHPRWYEDDDD